MNTQYVALPLRWKHNWACCQTPLCCVLPAEGRRIVGANLQIKHTRTYYVELTLLRNHEQHYCCYYQRSKVITIIGPLCCRCNDEASVRQSAVHWFPLCCRYGTVGTLTVEAPLHTLIICKCVCAGVKDSQFVPLFHIALMAQSAFNIYSLCCIKFFPVFERLFKLIFFYGFKLIN